MLEVTAVKSRGADGQKVTDVLSGFCQPLESFGKLLVGRFDGLSTVHCAALRRYRRDTGIPDPPRRYSRDIPSGPSRADCTLAVHSDHVSSLRGSQGGWHGRNASL